MAKFLSTAIPYGFAIGLSGCLAAVSGAHWFIQLQGQPDWVIAVAVFGSVCVSALVGVCAYLFGQGYGRVLVLVGLAFMAADSYQNGLGYQTVTGLTVSDEVEAAQSRLDKARADRQSVTLKREVCRCPQTKATNLATFESEVTEANAMIAMAKDDLAALTAPKAKTEYVMAVMAFLQIALSVLFACLGRGRKSEPAAVQAEQAQQVTTKPKLVYSAPRQLTPYEKKALAVAGAGA